MELYKASRFFDDIQVYDAYTRYPLFKAQIAAFVDNAPDGSISRRRVISVGPTVAFPQRRAVKWLSEIWLIGDTTQDGLQGMSLRKNAGAKKATDLFSVLTPGQAALGSAGTPTYGQKEYLKDITNVTSDSEYDAFWEISFSEAVSRGAYFVSGTTTYRARGLHQLLEGYWVAAADQLDTSSVSVAFAGSTFDPITETSSGSTVNTPGLLVDGYKLFEYNHASTAHMKAGDQTLVVAKSAITPVVGATVSSSGVTWKILTVQSDSDAWNVHVRRQ